MPELTPEAQARKQIDAMLVASGWIVQTKDEINLSAQRGVAICELSFATGEPDYTLFVDGKAIGTVEAKPAGVTLTSVEEQSAKYVAGVPFGLPAWKSPLPFCYESTSTETYFTNRLDPQPRSRRVFSFHRPETLLAWVQQEKQLAQRLSEFPPLATANLWSAQVEAITNLEKSFAAGRRRALIQMATGSGKTFTAVNFIYRLVKYAGAKRILFLVDRGNLGDQTLKEFQWKVYRVTRFGCAAIMNTPFHHPYRIDAPTLARAANAAGRTRLINASQLPENVRFVAVNPAVFTHAYLLLGEQPQRFVSDLTLYLSTVRAFFERADAVGGINVPAGANSDSRRRLSEDLGVALAAFFMVEVFGLSWESISQIPQNSKLSKKRPDFQGYAAANQRYLFEAKGTMKLQTVEKTMSKALTQVKGYPETAEAKIAIVSYLSADERFFPSTSFVVDPPALPEEVKPDAETSRLLHFEKVLQFAGLPQTAKDYVSTLSHRLREKHRIDEDASPSVARTRRIEGLEEELRGEFAEEVQQNNLETHRFRDSEFLGRSSEGAASKVKVFFGAQRQALESGISFKPVAQPLRTELIVSDTEISSVFADGTLLHITGLNGGKK